jgi:hypothetical protein
MNVYYIIYYLAPLSSFVVPYSIVVTNNNEP